MGGLLFPCFQLFYLESRMLRFHLAACWNYNFLFLCKVTWELNMLRNAVFFALMGSILEKAGIFHLAILSNSVIIPFRWNIDLCKGIDFIISFIFTFLSNYLNIKSLYFILAMRDFVIALSTIAPKPFPYCCNYCLSRTHQYICVIWVSRSNLHHIQHSRQMWNSASESLIPG